MSRSANIYALQEIDDEIDARTQRLTQIKALLGETQELLAARERLDKARANLAHWRAKQRDQDLVFQSLDQKRQVSEEKLYSGRIKNPKELSDIQEELASLNRRKELAEDQLLKVMLTIDEYEAEESEARKNLAQIESAWHKEQADLLEEKEALEGQLTELAQRRQGQTTLIPAADLDSYMHLRPRKGGLAVSILQGAECQGCMTSVSAARVKEARSDNLAYCGNCGRILYPGNDRRDMEKAKGVGR